MFVGLWLAGVGTDHGCGIQIRLPDIWNCLTASDFVIVSIGIFAVRRVMVNMEDRGGMELSRCRKEFTNPDAHSQGPQDCRFAF